MIGTKWLKGASFAAIFVFPAGCAIVPFQAESPTVVSEAERVDLAEAGDAVEQTPWPKIRTASLIERMTGAGDDAFSRADATAHYLQAISSAPVRAERVFADAQQNLHAAAELDAAAQRALNASRLSKADIAILEQAIQSLMQNRQVYSSIFRQLEKAGETVDMGRVDALTDQYRSAARRLGVTADDLAERIEHDRSRAYANPKPSVTNNLTSGT